MKGVPGPSSRGQPGLGMGCKSMREARDRIGRRPWPVAFSEPIVRKVY